VGGNRRVSAARRCSCIWLSMDISCCFLGLALGLRALPSACAPSRLFHKKRETFNQCIASVNVVLRRTPFGRFSIACHSCYRPRMRPSKLEANARKLWIPWDHSLPTVRGTRCRARSGCEHAALDLTRHSVMLWASSALCFILTVCVITRLCPAISGFVHEHAVC
jgi:hypothetical protein